MNSINNADNIQYSHDNVEQFKRMILYMPEQLLTYHWRWYINFSNQFMLTYRGENQTVRINFGASDGRITITRFDNFTESIVDVTDVFVQYPNDSTMDDSAYKESRQIFETLVVDALKKCG